MVKDFDADKFKELTLYLAEASLDDSMFGKTKLAKMLYYCDFLAYGYLGEAITGATYLRLPRGPVPKALNRTLSSIEDEGDGFVAPTRYFALEQQRLVARRPADISRFSAEEISLVDKVVFMLRDKDAAGVTKMSHLDATWQCTAENDEIPYDLIYVDFGPLSQQSIDHGLEVAETNGLLPLA